MGGDVENASEGTTIRQDDAAPVTAHPPPHGTDVKLGTVARAGDVCIQSGWWRCDAGGPVQYLRQGETMPQPPLPPRQTLWQKVTGRQPNADDAHSVTWKLVDKRQRPRSTAIVALAAAAAPPATMAVGAVDEHGVGVGTSARTGETCPASGWWRCDEPHALDGTRWFAGGSILPAATLPVPTGVFSKAGGPEFIQRRGAWSLVRHAATSSMVNMAASPAPSPSGDGRADDAPSAAST